MPDPMSTVLGRLGYVRRDDQAVLIRNDVADTIETPAYRQVVMIQGHTTGESWIRDHAGQLVVGAVGAILGLAALAVVALVAVVVTIGMVSCVAALAIAKAAVASSPNRGRR